MKRVIIMLLILPAAWSFNSPAAYSQRAEPADRDLVQEGSGLFASRDYAGAVRRFEEALSAAIPAVGLLKSEGIVVQGRD